MRDTKQYITSSQLNVYQNKVPQTKTQPITQQISQPNIVTILQEDLSVIPNTIIDLYITNLGSGNVDFDIVGLVKHIHFNPEYPEFENIRKQNKKMGTLSVYQDGTWVEKPCESIIKMMIANMIGLF